MAEHFGHYYTVSDPLYWAQYANTLPSMMLFAQKSVYRPMYSRYNCMHFAT